jgi:predicted ATPase/class 3 adenylate cyclase
LPTLPSGTVTFLFTDIEGSTRLWQEYPQQMKAALLRHDEILKAAIEASGGYVFKTVGDAFHATFDKAIDGLKGAVHAQLAIGAETWDPRTPVKVRMALHTGEAVERDNDYFGPTLNRSARLESIGYGGQILVSLVCAELVRDMLPDDVSLKEMGRRRLKDLTRPEEVYQVVHPELRPDFPPLKSLDLHQHNMPVQPTALIGREAEIAVVRSMLSSPAEPIVTLTGPGGMGKTRLALQVGAEVVEHFEHGVFFVDLSSIEDPELMPAAIGQALHLKESGNRPYVAVLSEFLKDRHILLILDNLEQIMASRDQIVTLTGACGGVKVIVTSREALRVRGEKVFNVPPLALPDLRPDERQDIETTSQYEAVRLFIERARAAKQNFRISNNNAPAVAEICVRLDGIPLAIELAAARIRMLSPEAILARLEHSLSLLKGGMNDLPVRQQALRATIDWSYNMLDDEHKRLFRSLTVFKGGFTLDAAESVFTDTPEDADLFQGIESLVDKSFVFPEETGTGEPRFHLLETMREYGIEKLKERGAFESLRDLHAGYFKSLVAALCPSLRGRELKGCLDQLDQDYGNIRDALSWLHIQDKSQQALEICGQIWRFWQIRGHLTEGREQTEKALRFGKDQDEQLRALALLGAGNLAKEQGDYKRALAALGTSYRIFNTTGNRENTYRSLHEIGWVQYWMNELDKAQKSYQLGKKLAGESSDDYMVARFDLGIGAVCWRNQQIPQARAHYEGSMSVFRRHDDRQMEAQVLCNLGIIDREEGKLGAAKAQYERAMKILVDIDDQPTLRVVLNNLGDISLMQSDSENARTHYQSLLRLAMKVGDVRFAGSAQAGLAEVALFAGEPEVAYGHAEDAYSLVRELGQEIAIGVSLRLMGEASLKMGKVEMARIYLKQSIPILESAQLIEELEKAKEVWRAAELL